MAVFEVIRTIGIGIGVLTGAGGLWLGIRAELRASRYSPLWVVRGGMPIRAINRTGEDATEIEWTVSMGAPLAGRKSQSHAGPDEEVQIYAQPDDPARGVGLVVQWTRPRTGRRYTYPRPRRRLFKRRG